MTYYKTLAETTKNGKTVTAFAAWEKFSANPRYQITVSRDGIGYWSIPAAKTTWKRQFLRTLEEV